MVVAVEGTESGCGGGVGRERWASRWNKPVILSREKRDVAMGGRRDRKKTHSHIV